MFYLHLLIGIISTTNYWRVPKKIVLVLKIIFLWNPYTNPNERTKTEFSENVKKLDFDGRSYWELFCKKKCSEVCFCLWVWDVLDRATSAEKKSSFVASGGGTLAKSCVLLKMSLFTWDIGWFWILIKRTNSGYLQNRHSQILPFF